MKGNKYIRLVGGLMCLLGILGCQSEEGAGDEASDGTWEVPVSFIVQRSGSSSASTGTKTRGSGEDPVYDNDTVRTLYTDRIQLNVYKRAKAGSYADDAEGFSLDKKVVLTCRKPDAADRYYSDNFRYAYATGVINMDKAYEYRCTAIGYAEQKGEQDMFSFEESNFSIASVSLTDATQYTTPELFFGTPRYGADMTNKEAGTVVFSYESGAINALGGWLYRCVAGVGLTLRKVPPEVKALALLTSAVNTQCQATCYDDFLTPVSDGKKTVPEGEEATKFVLDTWSRPDDWVNVYGVEAETDSIDVTMNESNLFPVTSTLYVRITIEKEDDEDDEIMVVPLRMKKRTTGSTSDSTDDTNSDEQLAEGTLVSERNHYYRIAGEYERLITKKLPLVIIINPNWDGDIDLTLDKTK